MSHTGPPAKTTEQKKLAGTYRADRDAGEQVAFEPFKGLPDPPRGLKGEAKTIWMQAVKILSSAGILYESDLPLVEQYAQVLAMLRKARTSIKYNSMVCDHTNKANAKNRVIAPEIKLYRELLSDFRMLTAALGFSPVDRARLKLQDTKDQDEFLDLLKKKLTR